MSNLIYLKQKQSRPAMAFRKVRDSLIFEMYGIVYEGVRLVRAFPYSLPNQYISVRSESGEELMLISDLSALDEPSRHLVREELRRYYLVPVIERILSVMKQPGSMTWQVKTDFGQVTFQTENAHDHIHSVGPERWVVTDLDDRRYLLADIERMDAVSRKYWKQLM